MGLKKWGSSKIFNIYFYYFLFDLNQEVQGPGTLLQLESFLLKLCLFAFKALNCIINNMNVIEVKNLKKYFSAIGGQGSVKAVDDISFEVKKGEIFGFFGPNGAGKTTTIRCMMDFIRPTSGQIFISGHNA
jgi:ABC-type glutathione transport system ATPase component